MASQASTITATGAQNVDFTKSSTDTITLVQVSGASYTGLTFTFNGSLDGTNFFPIPAINESAAAVVASAISPADGTTRAWRVPSEGLITIRVNMSALTVATSLVVTFQSGAFVGSAFQGVAQGTSLSATGVDATTATTFTIGSTNATAVTITPNTTVSGTLTSTGAFTASSTSALTGAVTCSSTLSCTALTATSIAATGTVALTNNMTVTDAKNIVLNATTGTKIGTATTQKLGFYNAAPVVQPAANTDTTTGAAGSTTTVFLNTTFTGSGGTAGYSVGGVVTALKALGLLAP